jgi:hypothetical protein
MPWAPICVSLGLLYQVDVNGAVAQLPESYDQGFRRTRERQPPVYHDLHGQQEQHSQRAAHCASARSDVMLCATRSRKQHDLTFSIGSGDTGPTLLME